MAFKLNKGEEERLDQLKKAMDEKYAAIETILNDYNEQTNKLQEDIQEEIGNYNNSLAELRSFAEDVAAERRNEYEEKSESWQDGDNGQAADEWISTWENADLEDVAIEFPGELTIDFENHAETDLPGEP